MTSTGEEGSTRLSAKVTVSTPKRMTTSIARRWITYLPTPGFPRRRGGQSAREILWKKTAL